MNKTTFQFALLLFRMKIVLDLECLIEEHINKSASVVPLSVVQHNDNKQGIHYIRQKQK